MKCHWLLGFLVVTLVMGNKNVPPCQYDSCASCIQGPTCMWCGNEELQNSTRKMERCMSSSDEKFEAWRKDCGPKSVIEPSNSFDNVEDNDFSEGTGGEFIHIKPQKILMDLRVKEPYNITIEYKHAKNYPIDLYYLMDGSKSMKDDKDVLSNLGQVLTNSIKNITTDFKLGFGIFVDKPILPYVSTVPSNDPSQDDCGSAPYAFRNYLPLTDNAAEFEETVRNASTACNIDSPEGGLDALMQVIVCEKQINWRNQSLRMIILATDAGFHYAGDGRLGGIITPNDMKCHLDINGSYTHSSITDYPSVSQIHNIAKEMKANVLFAITENQRPLYDRLTQNIEGASFGILNKDSSNVVDLLTESIEDKISTVTFKNTATPPLKIRYFSKCTDGNMTERSSCTNLKPGDVVKFVVEITLEECPENEALRNQVIKIYPEGRRDSVQVNVSMHCTCKCDKAGDKGFIAKAKQCNEHGDSKCGVCDCDSGYLGRFCECKENDVGIDIPSDNSCKMDNSSDVVCSGRGNCVCGKCQCHTREPPQSITGKFCQCTNWLNCGTSSGICSGNGKCDCNKCTCNAGWGGEYCDCQDSTENCRNPSTGEECSGQGECKCNRCVCVPSYFGKYCEDCNGCKGRCVEYKSCVQCQAFGKGELSPEQCSSNCTMFNITKVSQAEGSTDADKKLCSFFDDDDCRFVFVYYNNQNLTGVQIWVEEELECPVPVNALGLVLGVLGIVVLIGLIALFAWRILATIHDRKEYAKFVLAQNDAKWSENENPLYKEATTRVENPMFGANN